MPELKLTARDILDMGFGMEPVLAQSDAPRLQVIPDLLMLLRVESMAL